MALAPNAKDKLRRLMEALAVELRGLAQSKGCTVDVVPPSGDREVPLIQLRNGQQRLMLELYPALPTWRAVTVFSYAAEMNDVAEELGSRISRVQDDDDRLCFQAEVKKQR